jgi:iron donor protein CyaY
MVGRGAQQCARCDPVPAKGLSACARSQTAWTNCYTGAMLEELDFRRQAESALDALKRHLIVREEEDEAGFEVEEQNGVLNIVFEEPAGKFVVTPNTPVRQIWISALSTSFKLDWDATAGMFVLSRTGEKLIPLVDRLIAENMQG